MDVNENVGSKSGLHSMPAENKHLVQLARIGDYEAIQEWIAAGNVPDYRGCRPYVLPDIVWTGFLSVLRLLLRSYDWKQWQNELDAAIETSVRVSRADFVDLLIKCGANPEKAEWCEVFATHNESLIVSMIQFRNDLENMFEYSITVSKPVMAALRKALAAKPEVEPFFISGIIEAFEGQWETWRDEELQRAKKLLRILVWAGVDPRREVEVESYYEDASFEDSLLGMAVRRGDWSELKMMHPTQSDLPVIRKALLRSCQLDDRKLKLLLDCHLELNDREDGTSSYLHSAIIHDEFKNAILLGTAGARLPPLTKEEFRTFRRTSLYQYKSPFKTLSKEDIYALNELLPPDQQAAYRRSVNYPVI